MLGIIANGVTSALSMGHNVIGALFHESGQWRYVQDVIGLQIGMAVIGWAIVKVKSLVYGF